MTKNKKKTLMKQLIEQPEHISLKTRNLDDSGLCRTIERSNQ